MGEDDHSSSRSEASVKEKSKSKSPEAEELVGGGGGGGGGAPASSASKLEKIALYIAIVALVLCLIALALSCYLTWLWWYWNLVLTVPALAIALVALFFAPLCPKKKMPLFQPGHHEISLGFGALGIILGLAGLIWCCVEIGWAHSNQKFMGGGGGGGHDRLRREAGGGGGGGGGVLKRAVETGRTCHGEAFDWGYQSKALVMKHDCDVKDAKLKKKKASSITETVKSTLSGGGNGVSYPRYDGVDSYSDSPVYKSHANIVTKNSLSYGAVLISDQIKQKQEESCKEFDKKVGDFYKAREKCDKALKAMKPKCKKNEKETEYEYKITKFDGKKAKDECGEMLDESKYYKALSGREQRKMEEKMIRGAPAEEEGDGGSEEIDADDQLMAHCRSMSGKDKKDCIKAMKATMKKTGSFFP